MGWLSFDVIGEAFNRSKKALLGPFNFWKWIKLGLIVILIGGGGSSFSNSFSYSEPSPGEDIEIPLNEITGQINQFWDQYIILILAFLAFFLLIILVFGYISNVMEFVLVESLVTNSVFFWSYSGKYMKKGFDLFVIRLILGLFLFALLIVAMEPIVTEIIESGKITSALILELIPWFILVIFGIAIINAIIQSFINLSIPLAMYNNLGIIKAFNMILDEFKVDWKQVLVYWIVRLILGIIAGITMFVAGVVLFILTLIILAIPAVILYYLLLDIEVLFWILMIPYGLIGAFVFILLMLVVAAPAPVFMKYHMLVFLDQWFKDAGIPFFDMKGEVTGGYE